MIVADLTDLELTVLGIIWKDGPSTAYALMRELAESPTSHYRAGAGSIYPLVARLKKRGYLNSEDGKQGRHRGSAGPFRSVGRRIISGKGFDFMHPARRVPVDVWCARLTGPMFWRQE